MKIEPNRKSRLRPSRRHHPRPLWIVNAVARHSWRVQYWCLSRPSARLPFAAEARGVVQLETFSRAYIAGLWEVIGGAV